MPSIHPFTEADIAAGTDLIVWQKLSQTINRVMWNDWPDMIAQTERSAGAIRGALENPHIKHFKAVDDASGELLAYLVLSPQRRSTTVLPPTKEAIPEPATTNSKSETKPPEENSSTKEHKPNLNEDAFAMVIAAISEINAEMAEVDYIEMPSFIVKQGFRNKGVGRQLMDVAFDYARSEALPIFIRSEPAATPFFERLGFQKTKEVDMDLSQHAKAPYEGFGTFRLTGMIWSPLPPSASLN